MAQQIQIRRDIAANWTSANPILAQGEMGLETNTNKVKIGDGSSAWNSLSYFGGAGALASLSDVSFTSLASGQFPMANASGLFTNQSLSSLIYAITSLGSLAVMNQLSFTSLTNQPSLSSLAFQSTIDYNSAQLLNKPSLGSLAVMNQLSFTSLTNQPSLGSLAFQDVVQYSQVTGVPSLGSLAVMNQLSFTSLTNQPSLGSIAFQNTVDYSQLTNTPSLGSLAVMNQLSFTSLLNQPSLSSLAFQSTVDYSQITGTPSLGSLAIMNQLSFTSLTNQPSLSSLAFQSTIDYTSAQLTNKPSLGSLAVMNQLSFTSLTNQPSLGSLAFGNNVVTPLVLSGATLSLSQASIVHNNLGGLTTGDPHTQYALLAGRSGGQTLTGGTAANNLLILRGTSANGNTATNTAVRFGVGDGGGTTVLDLKHDGSLEQTVSTTTSVAGYSLTQTITGTSGDSFGASYAITDTGGGSKTIYGFRSALYYSGTTTLGGMQSTSNVLEVTNGGTVSFAEVLTSNLVVDGSSTIDEATLIKLFGVTKGVGSTITTLTGLYLPNLAEGTTNWSIYSEGGSMYHAGQIQAGVGSVGLPAYSFNADNDIGMYRIGANILGFSTAGTEAMRIGSTRNVSIGTTTNNAAKLHIDQNSATGAITVLTLDQTDTDVAFIDFIGTSGGGTTTSISTAVLGAYQGKIKVEINGVVRWIPFYN